MALIVEDGSIVADANSFRSLDDLKAYATARGVDLGDDDAAIEVMAIKAMDYLETLKYEYRGKQVDPDTQSLSWPRKCVYVGNDFLATDTIPDDVTKAQSELVLAINSGIELMPNSTVDSFVIREKVGPIETEYSEAVKLASSSQPRLTYVMKLLKPLLNAGFGQLRTVRV